MRACSAWSCRCREFRYRVRLRPAADRRRRLAGAPLRRHAPRCAPRGRQPRLAVVDSAAVDSRRHLVIIRRDNVEHLLMIGGPSDVVVETNIVRAAAARPEKPSSARQYRARSRCPAPCRCPTRRRGRCSRNRRPLPSRRRRADRSPPLAEDDPWQPEAPAIAPAPEVRPVRPADTLAGLAEELARPDRSAARRAAPAAASPSRRVQPRRSGRSRAARPRRRRPPTSRCRRPLPAADQSLAEMAQRARSRAAPARCAQKVVAETAASHGNTVEVKAGAPKPPVPQPTRRPRQPKPAVGQSRSKKWRACLSRPRKDLNSRGVRRLRPSHDGGGDSASGWQHPRTRKTSASISARARGLTERVIQLIALLTVLSLAPSILVMMTSFTRIVVVLSLLAHRARHRDRAAQFRDRLARAVPHRLRDGPGVPARL